MRAAYATVVALARTAARFTPPGDAKFLRALRARRGVVERIEQQARTHRDRSRPLVWLHAPSVGEGLQARPVAQAIRLAHPTWQIAYTYFSPSAESFAASVGADITEYLPFDSARDADAVLNALSPSVLVFAKLDVWPTLVARAVQRGVPVVMISGTLAARSGRRGWWSRQLVHDAYASLRAVGVIDAEHGARLRELGVSPAVLQVTGDTRFDQVVARAAGVNRDAPLLRALSSTRPTVVAGSTWPADEAALLDAWAAMVRGFPLQALSTPEHDARGASRAPSNGPSHGPSTRPRLLIAPHEPTAAHCAPIERWASDAGLSLRRVSNMETEAGTRAQHDDPAALSAPSCDDIDVVLIDRVGILGDLYALADVAFVGGGFHAAGLHSVIEPAAFGAPVLFGPRFDMSREAELLLANGGAISVTSAQALRDALERWLRNPAVRVAAGQSARALVESERGATQRSVQLIERVMKS